MELTDIKGVGPKTLKLINDLGIYNINDLVRFYPYRYNIYSPQNILEVNDDETVVISGIIESTPSVSYIKRNFNRLSFRLLTNNMTCNVTIFNRAFMARNLTIGKNVTLIGKYNRLKNTFVASDIKFYTLTHTKVEPVYHLVNGLSLSSLSKIIISALNAQVSISEIVPDFINDKYQFMDTYKAIKELHIPSASSLLKQAQLKLKYEELFSFMFKINLLKFKNQIFDDFIVKQIDSKMKQAVLDVIPFSLTNDQIKAIDDIIGDFNAPKKMNRLILGDVGSGKTIVSFIAMLLNYQCGYQSAMLAPTEVLAHQHYENLTNLLKDTNIKIEMLVGSQKKSEKNKIINDIREGNIDIVIGTHALLEDNVEFNNIGLVVTDEQHRFGVNQRKNLQNKGNSVDVLYMSATPIPRTYALTIYGDMDISMIKEKPSGRLEILTKLYKKSELKKVSDEMNKELLENHQIYVVAPLIEENEDLDLSDINNIKEELEKYIDSQYNIAVLHSKMKNSLKEEVMQNFKDVKINILISTTVIEVGVDVKNATMMVIFNAERFGLATLHQLRGRVGRNSLQSKCLLISDKETERLKVLEESNDGFYISECDFKIRGGGDLFGVRQSGDMIFKIADIKKDYKILLQCKKDSEEFINSNIENNFRDYPYYQNILQELMNND